MAQDWRTVGQKQVRLVTNATFPSAAKPGHVLISSNTQIRASGTLRMWLWEEHRKTQRVSYTLLHNKLIHNFMA